MTPAIGPTVSYSHCTQNRCNFSRWINATFSCGRATRGAVWGRPLARGRGQNGPFSDNVVRYHHGRWRQADDSVVRFYLRLWCGPRNEPDPSWAARMFVLQGVGQLPVLGLHLRRDGCAGIEERGLDEPHGNDRRAEVLTQGKEAGAADQVLEVRTGVT